MLESLTEPCPNCDTSYVFGAKFCPGCRFDLIAWHRRETDKWEGVK